MQPYVIRQGDYLLSLAYQFSFDPDAVWNDPKNADLKQLRKDPSILLPGDLLYIPDQDTPPAMHSLSTGTTNSFTSTAPTVILTHKFIGENASVYASRAYTVNELPALTGLATNGDGVASFEVPVTLSTVTVVFTDTGEWCALQLGTMDPIGSLIGIFKRLRNLGYVDDDATFDMDSPLDNVGLVRSALLAFKTDQGVLSPPSAPSDPPPSSPAPASDAAPATLPPNSSPPASSPASDPAPASIPPNSSGPPSDAQWPTDGSGLGDDGVLDADTTALLFQVHGC